MFLPNDLSVGSDLEHEITSNSAWKIKKKYVKVFFTTLEIQTLHILRSNQIESNHTN